MKKIALRTISCILLVAVFVSSMVFAQAEPELVTEFIVTTETNEYYNLEDGLYTKKTVKGPYNAGTENEYYDVTLDTYTSDVTLISSVSETNLDITFLVDVSSSLTGDMKGVRDAITKTINNLYNNYESSLVKKIHISIISFGTGSTQRIGYTNLYTNKKDILNTVTGLAAIGGTHTGTGLETAYDAISARKNTTGNKQVLILFTDGVPGSLPGASDSYANTPIHGGGNIADGQDQTNKSIIYANKIKALGAKIFTVGLGGYFEDVDFNTQTTGLAQWVTKGFKIDNGMSENVTKGWGIRKRQIGLLMNIWSSNWLTNTPNKTYDVGKDWKFDNESAKSAFNNYSGTELYLRYTSWIKSNSQYSAIPSDYYLNPELDEGDTGYFLSVGNTTELTEALSASVKNAIKTTYVCQGSLLKDFQIKDTVSDYFEIINTENEKPQFYKLSYIKNSDGEYYEYIPNDSNNTYQYGANKRAFGSEEPLNNIVYNINGKTLSVTGFSDASQVTDVFKIVDNNVVEGGEHTGNMFRIKYKIRPIDSHMGGRNVPIANEAQSGICKSNGTFVQNFDDLSVYNGVPTLKKDFAKFPVALVEGNYIANPENVKLGLIYDVKDLGKNGYYEFSGRHNKSNVYHYKHNDKGNMVVVKSDNPLVEIPYSCETVGYKFGNTSYNNFQLTELKEEAQTVLNTYTLFMSDYLTDEGYSGSSMADVAIESFDEWKATQTNSIVFANKDNPAANAGAKNGTFYYEGWQTAKTNSFAINLNVYIPIVLSNDIYINEKSTVLANPETLSVNVYSWAEDIDNDSLSEDHFGLFKLENGILKRVSSDANVTFAKDVLGLDKVSLNITAQVTECVDKDGNKKAATDKLTNGDKIKVELKYNELEKAISESDILNETENTFKTVFKDFYTYSLCSDCNEGDGADRQQYQVKVHSTSNSITVNKSGCDTNNLNDSFVFAVIGAEETSNGEIDLNTSEVISVFSIHGNGTQVVPVDTTKFKYFKVIEDTNAIANKAWTWNYNGLKINGEDILNGYNSKSSSEGFVKLSIGESVTFDFENNYNEDCSNYHYSSGYCTNILQAETDTYVKNSHDKIMSMN